MTNIVQLESNLPTIHERSFRQLARCLRPFGEPLVRCSIWLRQILVYQKLPIFCLKLRSTINEERDPENYDRRRIGALIEPAG